jgi:RHS repeat-associated protein
MTTVTAPQLPYDTASNVTQFYFNSSKQDYVDYFYQGSAAPANLRRTISTNWATNGTPSSQTIQFEDNSTQSYTGTTFDSNGNPLTLAEYGSTGSVIRTTNWTYLSGSAYTGANILDRMTRVTVTDNATNTVRSRADIAYDESGYINYGTCRAGVPQHDDAAYSCTSTTRGNPTTVTTYSDAATPAGSILHHNYYDNLGNLAKADLDCCQSKTWAYSTATNFSYPDSATRGSTPGTQLTVSATYDVYTGLVATSTDENSQVTTYAYDLMKRSASVRLPDSNHTTLTWTYNDATPPTQSSMTASAPIQGSSVRKTTTTFDGLSRPVIQQVSDGTTTYSVVQAQYDPLGRGYRSSNPYNSSLQYWNESDFDALGRPVSSKLVQPDGTVTSGNTSTFAYATNTVTFTDPAGNARKTQVDGLGRMTSVFEPDVANGNTLTQQTSFGYNVLNLLTRVTQGVQSRAYAYDDIGRPNKATTPETGTVCFGTYSGSTCQTNGYDSFGNLKYRTDARGVVTTYTYDNLNRPTTISYSVTGTAVPATPAVTLNYDQGGSSSFALGRLTSMSDGVGSETYVYNNLGLVTQLQKVISGTTYNLYYGYNFATELNSITYPSGRNVQQNLDNIGRLSSVADTLNSVNTTRASGFVYNPAFEVTSFNYANGVTASFGYTSDRLLLQTLAYTKGSTTLFSANYWYKTDSANCPSAPAGNSGQIRCITDNVDSGRGATFTYDALYRLTSAATTGSTGFPKWHLTWGYDSYGNRLNQTVQSDTSPSLQPPPPSNSLSFASPSGGALTNRPDNMCFDASGNLMTETSVSPCPPSAPTYTYDAENRLVNYMGSSATYTYDGNGLRVKKAASGTTTVYIFSGRKVITEYDNGAAPTAPSREYIYSGGALLAKIESGTSTYFHSDHLSNRVLTDSSGNSLGQRGHYPFGENWYESGTTTKLKFTTYERDTETIPANNDYAMARTYINRFGRFTSADPVAGSLRNPQSLNRYTYGRNVPVSIIDPSGMRASGCLILKNQGTNDSSQPAGGYSDEESISDHAEPQAGCGSSTPGGFPLGGGNIFDILGEVAIDFATDQEIGVSFGALSIDDPFPLAPLAQCPFCGPLPDPPPPPVSILCKKALKKAGADPSALTRATQLWGSLEAAADYQNIDVTLLASVAIRETGINNVSQYGGGGGQGTFQLDAGTWGQVAWAYNPQYAAVAAAGLLSLNIQHYEAAGFGPQAALAGGIRAYNAGFGRNPGIKQFISYQLTSVDQSGLSAFADRGTTGNNYVTNVLSIMRNCFH